MKKIGSTLFALLFIIAASAQVPQSFKYQAVARNASGNPIASANIGVRLSIRDNSATGTIIYRETHTAITTSLGVFTISVGGGTVVSGSFSAIAWGTGSKFIEVEADFAGGTAYTSLGASQLLSVPYALYAASGTPGPQGPIGLTGAQGPAGLLTAGATAGNTPYWNGTNWVVNNSNIFNNGGFVGIGTTSPAAKLDIAGTIKVADGTQGAGKVLTSDANGLASWATSNSGGWSLTGNSGTVDGTNFIGTTDNKPFNIRVNNEKSGRIDASSGNTFYGYQSGNNTVIGSVNSGGGANTANGYQALLNNVDGYWNAAYGYQSLYNNTNGRQNVAIGYLSLNRNTTGFNNSATGYASLYSNTDGNNNTANGAESLVSNTTGYQNSAFGSYSLNSNNTGYQNTANGHYALVSNNTGYSNCAFGSNALGRNVSGSNNTAIGYQAYYPRPLENSYSNSTAIGAFAQVTASNMMVFGDVNVTKWGFGVSPDAGNAIQVGTNGTNGNGAYLTNGGAWTNPSDRDKKENFHSVNGKEVLQQIAQLPITRWNYKGEARSIQHIGPMAQDFFKLFQVGNNETSISTIDPAGIALVAIQELNKQNQEQQTMIESLQEEIKKLKEEGSIKQTTVGKLEQENKFLKSAFEDRLVKLEEMLNAKAQK
jgi:Chaperone of endosialidase